MKSKSLVLLAVAVGCGLVAMMGVQQVLSRNRKPTAEETASVLVATCDIPPGVPLNEANTTFKSWPKSTLPEAAVTKREQCAERSLRYTAVAQEVILTTKLGDRGQFGGSAEIPEGLRVGTVQVNNTKTHSGLILPGDFVDVVVTYKTRINNRIANKTKTVLEHIQVFSTDNVRKSGVSADATEINAKNISLLVDPHQYNVLMLAHQLGEITLALRNRNDKSLAESESVDDTMFEELAASFGNDGNDTEVKGGETGDVRKFLDQQQKPAPAAEAKPAAAPEKPSWTVRIYEGGKVREEKVEIPEPTVPKAALATPVSDVAGQAKGDWKGWLERFLIGA